MKMWALILLAHFPISPTETRVESRQTGGIQLVPELYATQALCERIVPRGVVYESWILARFTRAQLTTADNRAG